MIRTKVFARVGELIQGKLGRDQHVIIPGIISNHFYTETFIDNVPVGEELKPKPKKALEIFLKLKEGKALEDIQVDELEIPHLRILDHKYYITQVSNIPYGKGFTSISADCLSLLKALNHYFETNFSIETLYQIASKVTVVDPCLQDEIDQIFDPISGTRVFHLPELELCALYFDANHEGIVNPEVMISKLIYESDEEERFDALLTSFQEGLITGELNAIYTATLESAKINQRFNPKPKFNLLKEFAEQNGVGLFVSHVGSMMGLIGEEKKMQVLSESFKVYCKKHWMTRVYASKSCLDQPVLI